VNRSKFLAAAAYVAASFASADSASAYTFTDDPVLYWNQVLLQNVTGSPVLTSRTYAMFEVAMYEAVNASTGGNYQSYAGIPTLTGDSRAAAATAAHDVLLFLLPANGDPARTAQRAAIEQNYQNSLSIISPGQALTNGVTTGSAAATAVINLRTGDGSTAVVPYTPADPSIDGRYQLTSSGSVVTPQWGAVDPWIMNSGSEFRPGPPPAVGTPEYLAALEQVRLIGAAGAEAAGNRTAFQTLSAQYWASPAGTGLAPWINSAMAASDGMGLSTIQYAAMFAALTTSVADATIGIFDAKYFYDNWRPVTAINDLYPGSNWTSLLTAPLHPSYVSGHSGVGAAAADILMYYLGSNTQACFATFGPQGTCFSSFGAAAQNGANSRLWGGIHFSFDNQAGQTLGHQVAANTLASGFFQPVPEPATWMMMLLGFGLMGWAIRRQRIVVTYPKRETAG
jgi:hypothetical protein